MNIDSRQHALLQRTFLDYQPTESFLDNPLVVQRAQGLYYWDTDGKRYLDAIGGIFVAILGSSWPPRAAPSTIYVRRHLGRPGPPQVQSIFVAFLGPS